MMVMKNLTSNDPVPGGMPGAAMAEAQIPIPPNDPPVPVPPGPPGAPPGPDLPDVPVQDPPGPGSPLPPDPDMPPAGDPPSEPPVRMRESRLKASRTARMGLVGMRHGLVGTEPRRATRRPRATRARQC